MTSGPRFSPEVNARIFEAHELASTRGDTHADIAHLLVTLLSHESGRVVQELRSRGYDVDAKRALARDSLPPPPKQSGHGTLRWADVEAVQVTAAFAATLDNATSLAREDADAEVDEMHLLRAILARDDPHTRRALVDVDLAAGRPRSFGTSRVIEHLRKYGRVLTEEAREGNLDPVIGRVEEMARVIHILGRRRKNNPVLLGEPGVGKTAIVEGLAQAIVDARVPSYLADREIFALDVGSLVAGTKYRGEFESRIQSLLDSIKSSDGGVLMFVDELHLIARAGGAEGAIDAAGFLKPLLARGELRVIGATTIADYRRHVVGDGALERRFQPVNVREPTPVETYEMLEGLRPRYESHHGVTINDSALKTAIEASRERIPHRHLPDKAIDLIDEACSRSRALAETRTSDGMPSGPDDALEVTDEDVIAVLEAWVGDGGDGWAGGPDELGLGHQTDA
jgi:ATP-dependent Clp protease ATP-binding subunit ClpA